jgi:hypothetical protein
MSQNNIDFGTFPDDPSADAIRTAFTKVQNNFNQLFDANANSAVLSINRTPGAGITVNNPTGNVVVSANIACVQVSTSSLSIGRGVNGFSSATITSSAQTLVVDLNPNLVLSNYFASTSNSLAIFNGNLSTNSNAQSNVTSLGTLVGLNVSGNASFTGSNIYISNVSNLRITGGSPGNVLTTDGAGNLTWSAGGGGGGNGTPGGTNTTVQFNNNYSFGGVSQFTYNEITQLLSVPNVTVGYSINAANFIGVFSNGNSNISIPDSNGNVNISATGTANVLVITSTGVNVAGILSTGSANIISGNAALGNLASANYFTGTVLTASQPSITSLGTLTSLDITGNLSSGNANLGNLASANYFTGVLTTNAQPNITGLGTLSSLDVNGNANVVNLNANGNAIISGNLTVTGNATYYNITSFVVEDPIISLGGGPNGAPLTTDDGKDRGLQLQYYTTTPITAFMGWDNGNAEFAFGSNVSVSASEIVTYYALGNVRGLSWIGNINGAYANFTGNITTTGNANLGNTATANYFVGTFYGVANSATVANTVVVNAQPNITSVGTLTSLAVTGNTTSGNFVGILANGNSNINIPAADGNVNISAIGNANILIVTGTGVNVSGTGNFTGNLSASALYGPLANGNSNVRIATSNGNITLTAVGNTTMTVSGSGANVTGTANISGNLSAGNIAGGNLVSANFISGDGYLLSNLTISSGSSIVNGNSNVTVTANGNVTMYVTGNATARLTATSTGVVANGTFSTSGNANVGNLGTAQVLASANITTPQFISNVTTGTAPMVVVSTTQVANLNVATAGTVTTNAQSNITSVGTLSSLTVTGNISAGNVSVGNVTVTSYNLRSVATSISAAGTTQGSATALTKEINIVTTVSTGTASGVVLPTSVAGMVITITNTSANSLLVYPATGGTINSLAANGSYTQVAGATLQFIAPTTTQWYTVGATYA